MVLEAYIDDSYTPNGTFVLGGYIATVEAWAEFSREWEHLLPLTMRGKQSGNRRFKMSEMAHYMNRVPGFYKTIEKYPILALSSKIDLAELVRARQRIWVKDLHINWGLWESSYFLGFRCLMDAFHRDRAKVEALIPLDQKIDFYFDTQSSKVHILAAWDAYIAQRPPETKDLYGAIPRFENDEDFLPLQAADFWAWWVRKGYEENILDQIRAGKFGVWTGENPISSIAIETTEDDLVKYFMGMIRANIDWNHPIYDAKYTPRRTEIFAGPSRNAFASIWRWLTR